MAFFPSICVFLLLFPPGSLFLFLRSFFFLFNLVPGVRIFLFIWNFFVWKCMPFFVFFCQSYRVDVSLFGAPSKKEKYTFAFSGGRGSGFLLWGHSRSQYNVQSPSKWKGLSNKEHMCTFLLRFKTTVKQGTCRELHYPPSPDLWNSQGISPDKF